MKKILLFSSLLFLLSNYALSQNFNKEKEHLIAMSNDKSTHIFVEFLNEFGVDQEIGLGENITAYNEYKKTVKLDKEGNIKLKKNPFFTSMEYENNEYGIIKSIRLNFKGNMLQPIKDKLISLCGEPEETYSISCVFYVPYKYYIVLLSDYDISYLRINALDFIPNYAKYDEFGDAGMVYFDESPAHIFGDSSVDYMYFAYVYKKRITKSLLLKTPILGKIGYLLIKFNFCLTMVNS